jgi:hypothetical protein
LTAFQHENTTVRDFVAIYFEEEDKRVASDPFVVVVVSFRSA